MSFSTQRGRPRSRPEGPDLGTAELRRKHAAGLTAEPIDACLARRIIDSDQHWCGLHLRWLYTLRYGAPNLTSRYLTQQGMRPTEAECEEWRQEREHEFHTACRMLHQQRRYEPIMRLAVFNEWPSFLNPQLRDRAFHAPALAAQLEMARLHLLEAFDLLVMHWRSSRGGAASPQTVAID